MKAGTKVTVTTMGLEGEVKQEAKIARKAKEMLPLPKDYVPVRFASDGALLLVHKMYISA